MMLVENGTGVQAWAQGMPQIDNSLDTPISGEFRPLPDVHEDGLVPRSSGRADLYPGIPHHFRGPEQPAAGLTDEVVTAPEPEVPATPQAPRMAMQLPPVPATPAVTG